MMVKAQKILSRSEILQMDYVNFVLEAAASSARFGTITEFQPNGKFVTRANIHACLVMPFGSGKSTNFIQLGQHDCIKTNDIKFSGAIGTINKDGDFHPGSVLKAGGKLLVIDEFQKLDDATKDAMNSLLEYPHTYGRQLGNHVKRPYRMKSKYSSVCVNGGTIDVYSKFSCITGGMYINKDNDTQKAWFSRFIPIVFTPEMEWYKQMTLGLKPLKINPHMKEMDFQVRDYAKYHDEYWKKLEQNPFFGSYFAKNARERGYIPRNMQDILRVACFIASLENRQILRFADIEQALKFQPIMLSNSILSSLTDVEQMILNHPDWDGKKLSASTNTTESNISQRKKEMKDAGLIVN